MLGYLGPPAGAKTQAVGGSIDPELARVDAVEASLGRPRREAFFVTHWGVEARVSGQRAW